MYLPIEIVTFKDNDPHVLKSEVKVAVLINRLFISCIAGVDFVVCGAAVQKKVPVVTAGDLKATGDTTTVPVALFAGDGEVHATLFTETAFGIALLSIPVEPGDVVELTVRCTAKTKDGFTRQFFGAWDCFVPGSPGVLAGVVGNHS